MGMLQSNEFPFQTLRQLRDVASVKRERMYASILGMFGDQLLNIIPSSQNRVPITGHLFLQLCLPTWICYHATAILVLLPGTFHARLALLPVTLWYAFRSATKLDLVARYNEERLAYFNQGLTLGMFIIAVRAVIWTFQTEPFHRIHDPHDDDTKRRASSHKPGAPPRTGSCTWRTAMDALNLICNLRGIGWNWSSSKGRLHVPTETRPRHSRLKFLLSTLISAFFSALILDVFRVCVQSFSPTKFCSPHGDDNTIFDHTLPPIQRYLRSSLITLLSGLTMQYSIQFGYDLMTLTGVGLLGNEPWEWPPLFDSPVKATSLAEFWSRRWHQLFRDLFVGFLPSGKKLKEKGEEEVKRSETGRAISILTAFFLSTLLHIAGLWGMGRGMGFWSVTTFFLMNGLGVILERTWTRVTGHKVRGALGWVWTLVWLVGWGNLLVDVWTRTGVIASFSHPDGKRPMDLLLPFILKIAA